jgi:RNA recognition motif-containing protein
VLRKTAAQALCAVAALDPKKIKEKSEMSWFSIFWPFGKKAPVDKGQKELIEIYVGNLSYDMTGEQLRKAFAKYGTVKSARVIENRYNHKSKGFGFVEMIYRIEAEAAIKALHDKNVMGRRLRVNEAKNKIKA